MPVLINFKICDNAKECNGVASCPTGALFWDKNKKSVGIDNDKCISCDICENACMVHAIKVAHSDEEYTKYQKEIDDDPRKIADLYLDRYGAQPILPAFLIKESQFETAIAESGKITAIEIFENEGIMCMLRSIPIRDLFDGMDIKYHKMEIATDSKLMKKYEIDKLPSLLFFREGKLLGKVEGYFEEKDKEILKDKVAKILDLS